MKLTAVLFIGLTIVLLAAIWGASEVWFGTEEVDIGFHGGFALILGVLGSLLVGGTLMALLFFSSRYGYDEQVFSADDESEWDRDI